MVRVKMVIGLDLFYLELIVYFEFILTELGPLCQLGEHFLTKVFCLFMGHWLLI
jgi:hypothetical protein